MVCLSWDRDENSIWDASLLLVQITSGKKHRTILTDLQPRLILQFMMIFVLK